MLTPEPPESLESQRSVTQALAKRRWYLELPIWYHRHKVAARTLKTQKDLVQPSLKTALPGTWKAAYLGWLQTIKQRCFIEHFSIWVFMPSSLILVGFRTFSDATS